MKSQDKPVEGPKILKQYQHYEDVFSEEKAKRFSPSRDENMNIKFVPGAPTNLDCKIYPLNVEERAWMIKQIGEELDHNFIKEGASPIVLPTFLVPKKQKGDY